MKQYNTSQFEKDLQELHIGLTSKQMDQFMTYYELLAEWNAFMNLTAITEFDEVLKKHFVDSLSLVKAYDGLQEDRPDADVIRVIDVGTGAGFPGIPLKIAFPSVKVTLLDSLNKRIRFLETVIENLNLQETEAVHGRAEDYARQKEYREKYDLCVSRAVANLSSLSEYCLPFVKKGGKFISFKSEKVSEEVKNAEKAIEILGGRTVGQSEFYLPSSDIFRNLIVIEKIKITPGKYPRKAGLPAKDPLT